MKNIIYITMVVFSFILSSCENNLIDEGLSIEYVDQTTSDFLKGHSKFVKVMKLFEAADLIDELNTPNTTVIVPTDFTVDDFVVQLQEQKRTEQNDENLSYTFDDLLSDFNEYQDSMKMYIIHEIVGRDELNDHDYTVTTFLGTEMIISLEETLLYTEWIPNSKPKLVQYKWIINGKDPENEEVPATDRDRSNICQTSGIITKTGIIHVLEDTHKLFFNQRP